MREKPTHKSASVVKDMVFAGLLGGGLGLWLLLRIIRFKVRAGHSATTNEMDAAMRARGKAALLGALFGCPAALCIYDKLYPYSSYVSPPPCAPEAEPMSAPAAEEHPQEQHAEDRPWQGVGLG